MNQKQEEIPEERTGNARGNDILVNCTIRTMNVGSTADEGIGEPKYTHGKCKRKHTGKTQCNGRETHGGTTSVRGTEGRPYQETEG